MALPFINLLILQLTAHFLCDFIIQNEAGAQAKNKNGFNSKHLYIHILLVWMLSFLLSFNISFWWCSVVISISHFIIDGLKASIMKKIPNRNWFFFADQLIHLLIIFAITSIYAYRGQIFNNGVDSFKLLLQNKHALIYILGYLLCLKPANILIKQVIGKWLSDVVVTDNKLEEAGRLIGNIERVMILSFILLNQFAAIGFLLAAKSVLRFKESEASKMSEYVLLGTLISFSIAIIIGLSINGLLKTL
jgi:hypothetical protein